MPHDLFLIMTTAHLQQELREALARSVRRTQRRLWITCGAIVAMCMLVTALC
ncbi:MAG: hypothetical protein KA791_10490 [Flavobacteriales bacterium]|jgi:predicted dinucleotide-utilizing enzyme|nr:hypothetical protein [Flavobacteriales bacterium]